MLEIKLNKSPLTMLKIPDDLKHLTVTMDIEPSIENKSDFFECRDKIEDLLREKSGYGGFFCFEGNKIELAGLEDIDIKIAKMALDHPYYQSEFHLKHSKDGILHTVQLPVKKLLEQGFIDQAQFSDINLFVEKQVHILREQKRLELEKNESIIKDTRAILKKHEPLLDAIYNLKLNSDSYYATISVFRDLKYYDGDLAQSKARLLYLLLNEGAVDALLLYSTLPNIEISLPNDFIQHLLQFQKDVMNFVKKNQKEIVNIIEKNIVNCASWFQKLYEQWVNNNKPFNFFPTTAVNYQPISNIPGLGVTLFAPTPYVRAQVKAQAEFNVTSKDLTDDEMLKSSFAQQSNTAKRLR